MQGTNLSVKDFNNIDNRIILMNDNEKNNNFYQLQIPKHKPFTEILQKLANCEELSSIDNISGRRKNIQMELLWKDTNIEYIKELGGVEIITKYQYPTDSKQIRVVIMVDINNLLNVLNTLDQQSDKIGDLQVYDFL